MTTILRPLSTSELLDRTFHLYRNNFLIFVGISAIPQLCILPLTLGGAAMMARHQASTATAMLIAGYLLYFWAVFLAQVPTVSAVGSLHLERAISIGSAYSTSWRSFPRVVWIVFLISLLAGALFSVVATLIGSVAGLVAEANLGLWIRGINIAAAIVVPGYLLLRWILTWSLVIPITVLEGGWFRTSIRRSRFLVKNSRWRIFVIGFLMVLLGGVTTITVQSILLFLVSLFGINDYPTFQAVSVGMQAIGLFVSTTLVGGLGTIAICLFYYDQRVRKEGFDLQLMVATLEKTAQNPAAASAL